MNTPTSSPYAIRVERVGDEKKPGKAIGFVVVLGEPHYYRRFGFVQADEVFGLGNEYGCSTEFQVLEISAGALRDARGSVLKYAAEFGEAAV